MSSNLNDNKAILEIWFNYKERIYNKYYNIWYDHYKSHLKKMYIKAKIRLSFDVFCKFMFDGTKKKMDVISGLKIPVLI